ncbi:hypothetical protein [Longimicrobium sp.]|uniref:hypothetical protein n=1 Tax=Longimicrobium sp. TaxID=2029185 RepID=UPI003B3BB756
MKFRYIPTVLRGHWLTIALACVLGACAADGAPAGAQTLGVESPEVYVEINPANGYLFVREYYLSTLEQDSTAIAAQVAEISALVQNRGYCKARYAFAEFTSMEEKLYRDRDFIAVECSMLSRGRNLRTQFTDAFGRVLNRSVAVSIDSTVGLSYRGLDVQVRGNNSLGVHGKDDESVIFWRNGTPSFEIVFGPADREVSTYRSLAPYVAADVASPTVTKAEVDAWRRGSADPP